MRPVCIADAYISIWDSLFRDRGGDAGSRASKWVHAVEARSLRAASAVLVDTAANRALMINSFGLDASRVHAWPLAIDESFFLRGCQDRAQSDERAVRVLFVGTLIPLHGVEKLLEAVAELRGDPAIEFRIVGDGQMAPLVEAFMATNPDCRLTWDRAWRPLGCIAEEIAQADVCLGVFGGDAKAARVLPFKLYMYLAAGKAIVSQSKLSTPLDAPVPPMFGVDPASGGGLAEAIRTLARDRGLREGLASQARDYYLRWLGNDRLRQCWNEYLRSTASPL
jgi:glycosyltransferase involved in cell wall biosynthesis